MFKCEKPNETIVVLISLLVKPIKNCKRVYNFVFVSKWWMLTPQAAAACFFWG